MACLRLFIIMLAAAGSSNAWADLRTYDVDSQYRQEIFSALQNVLREGEYAGRVQLLPSGQILVNASPETLEQVEQVLQAIRARPAPAAPRVSLRYWGVLGTRAQNADSIGTQPPAALDDVLGELRRLYGDVEFRVIGTAAVATNSGQRGEVRGTTLLVEQTARVQGDTMDAEISMRLFGNVGMGSVTVFVPDAPPATMSLGSISLRTTLNRGEFVVLGENHVQAGGIDGPVFYIVHWEE
jgi:hypothetical protein